MIKKLKYTAFGLLTLIFILFSGETASSKIDAVQYKQFDSIYFNKVYNPEKLSENILALADKYDCYGYMPVYEHDDIDTTIFCCTKNAEDRVKRRLGFSDVSFNSILGEDHKISFSEISPKDMKKYIATELFIDGEEDDIDAFSNELSEKYSFTYEYRSDTLNYSIVVGGCCLLLMVLLTIYDIMDRKRDVCISLTLGNSLLSEIVKCQISDTLYMSVCTLIISLAVCRFTGAVVVWREYLAYLLVNAAVNAIMFFSFYAIDICSTLKNENERDVFIALNYLLKVFASASVVFLVMFSVEISKINSEMNAVKNFQSAAKDYSRIETAVSSHYAEKMDAMSPEDGIIDENSDFLKLHNDVFADTEKLKQKLTASEDHFILGPIDIMSADDRESIYSTGRIPNVIYATDSLKGYIENVTKTKLDSEKITILVPKNHYISDVKAAESFIEFNAGDKNTDIEYLSYEKAEIACYGVVYKKSLLYAEGLMNTISSPVVIYYPDSSEYGYLDSDTIFIKNTDKNAVSDTMKKNGIKSLSAEIGSVEKMTEKVIRREFSYIFVYLMVTAALVIYYIIIFMATALLDISLKRHDRAISMVFGNGFFKRHINAYLSLFVVFAIACGIALFAAYYVDLKADLQFFAAAAAMLLGEMFVYTLLALKDEKSASYKALKGGTL